MGAELLGIEAIWIALAGLIFLAIGYLGMVGKKDAAMAAGVILLLIGGGLYLSEEAVADETEDEDEPDIEGCESTTTPSITPLCINKHSPGTSLTEDIEYRLQGEKAWNSGTCGTAITAWSPGDKVEYVVANASSPTPTQGSYYTAQGAYTVPCKETGSFTTELAAEATAANIGVAYKNDNDEVSTAMVLGAGDVKTGSIKVTGEYQKDFGNADVGENSNVLVCMYNATEIDKVILGSPEYSQVTVPQLFTEATNAENKTIAWAFPVLESNENTGWIPFTIDADDTNNPGTGAAGSSDRVRCLLYDSNYYLHGITGEYEGGVETEDNEDIGIASTITPELGFTYS